MSHHDTGTPRLNLETDLQWARALAGRLSGVWRVDCPVGDTVILHGPKRERLRLLTRGRRLHVVGLHPEEHWRVCSTPTRQMTASLDKGPERLAREISRRLLQPYRDDLARIAENMALRNERLQTVLQTVAAIRQALGTHLEKIGVDGRYDFRTRSDRRGSFTTGKYVDGTLTDVQLSRVPLPLALALARTIADYKREERSGHVD